MYFLIYFSRSFILFPICQQQFIDLPIVFPVDLIIIYGTTDRIDQYENNQK